MKLFYPFCLLFVLCLFSFSAMSQAATAKEATPKAKVLRHVVLFKFKDGTSPEKIKEVEDAFTALPKKINTIIGYEWGKNISPENLAQGFTHCFLVTFKDAAGRDYYLPHPDHKAFGQILGPSLDKVLVIDFIDEQ